jgi:glycosyltransferase involved in cell wall biosynthesis
MKVVQLGPYPPPHGGVQTNLVAIRRFLLERGVACAVINLTRFRKREGNEIYYPRSALALLRLLMRRRYDVIHLHLGGSLTRRELALGFVLCRIPWCKKVLTFHSGGYPSSTHGRNAHPRTLRGVVFRGFDAIIAVNESIERLFHSFGVPADRVHLIAPHAVVPPEPEATLPHKLQRFFEEHDPVLLTVSGLEPEYDLPIQMKVLPLLRERFPKAGLAIIGFGSLEREIASRIGESPCADHILLSGDVTHSATLQAIARSDVLLRTTLYDGDSVAVREALHFGTPVIATDNGMRPSGVELVPVSDEDALYRALESVLARPRAPRIQLEANDANVQAILELYEELVSSGMNDEIVRGNIANRA